MGTSRKPEVVDGSISLVGKIVFALPAFALAGAMIFHHTYQTKFYVDDVGMSPQLFALVNAVVRSTDLFAYPVTGWIVDNSFVAAPSWLRGRRRPFFIVLAPLVAVLFYLLYSPPSLSPGQAAFYYGGLSIIYNMMPLSLSYNALGAELSDSYDEPGEVFGWKHAAACLGMMAGVLTPGLMSIFEAEDHVLAFPAFALFVGVLIVVLFFVLAAFTASRVTHHAGDTSKAALESKRISPLGALLEKPIRMPRGAGNGWCCECVLLGAYEESTEEPEQADSPHLPVEKEEEEAAGATSARGGASAGGDAMVVVVGEGDGGTAAAPARAAREDAEFEEDEDAVGGLTLEEDGEDDEQLAAAGSDAGGAEADADGAETEGEDDEDLGPEVDDATGLEHDTAPMERVFPEVWDQHWELEAAASVPEGRAALAQVHETPREGDADGAEDVPPPLRSNKWQEQCLLVYTVERGIRRPVNLSACTHLMPLHPGGPQGADPPPSLPIVPGVNWGARNELLVVLLLSLMALSLSRIVSHSLMAFYCQYVLQPDHYEWWLGLILAVELVAATVATPYWLWLSTQGKAGKTLEGDSPWRAANRTMCLVCGQGLEEMDQRSVFVLGTALAIPAVLLATFVLDKGDTFGFALVMLWTGFTEGGCEFLLAALIKTTIDYDARFTGLRREAQYLTYISVVTHWVDIPASSLVLSFLSSAGYTANATQQPAQVVFLLKIFTMLVPGLFMALALGFAAMFPIGRQQHRTLFGLHEKPSAAADGAGSSGGGVERGGGGGGGGGSAAGSRSWDGAGSGAYEDEDDELRQDDVECCGALWGDEEGPEGDGDEAGSLRAARDKSEFPPAADGADAGAFFVGADPTDAGPAAPGRGGAGRGPDLPRSASQRRMVRGGVPATDLYPHGPSLLSPFAQHKLARAGVLFVERDVVSGRLLVPPELRYAVSMGWLLDEFGLDTVEELASAALDRERARASKAAAAAATREGMPTPTAAGMAGKEGAPAPAPEEGADGGDGSGASLLVHRRRAEADEDAGTRRTSPAGGRTAGGDQAGGQDGGEGEEVLDELPAARVSLCCRHWPCRGSLQLRELIFASLWSSLLIASCIVVGVLAALEFAQSIALTVLLIVGGSGLVAMYHCLRLRAAGRAGHTTHRKIRRYLQMRHLCDGLPLEGSYNATRFDGGSAVAATGYLA